MIIFPQQVGVGAEGGHLRLWWDLHLSLSCNPQAEKSQNPQEKLHESRRAPALHPAPDPGHRAPHWSDSKVLEAVSQTGISSEKFERIIKSL